MHLTHRLSQRLSQGLTQGLAPHRPRRWFRFTRRTQAPQTRGAHHHVDAVLAEDEPLLGCGWFDSSHELMRGLLIVEVDR